MSKKLIPSIQSGKFTFTGPFVEKMGEIPIYVLGTEYPALIVKMRTKDGILDPENLRLVNAKNDDGSDLSPNESGAGQKRIQKYMNDSSQMKAEAKLLEESFALAGGQNELLMVQKGIYKEGNRRASLMLTKGIAEVLCLALPDEMSEEAVFAYNGQKHLGGFAEWDSYVKSKAAHHAYVDLKWPIEQVRIQFRFKSNKDALKYIHAYVWYEKSGLTEPSEWSKFHHAYVPTLASHFGYDDDNFEFNPMKRKAQNTKTPTPAVVDAVAGVPTDFQWFVNLIKDGKLTDCRQADGILAPAIRLADDNCADKLFELINENPPANAKPGAYRAPCQKAWDYLVEVRNGSTLSTKLEDVADLIKTTIRSNAKLKDLKNGDKADLLSLGATLNTLQTHVSLLQDKIQDWLRVKPDA